jgi:hypothetical protein
MQRVRLILSFDHELSLGGTESYRRNLFDPTDELLRLAADLDVPIALFTDVLCAYRYEQWDPEGFFLPYCRQLRRALAAGHDVQLHIHPHWVTSRFVDGVYRPSTDFALSDFEQTAPPNDIRGIVDRAHRFLTELCRAEQSGYRCIAYRAGGHNLSPATSSILSALYENGIRIDSSIVKGFRFRSNISTVDQTGMPASANWTIPLQGPLSAQSDVGIFEIPVASKPRTPLNNVPFLISRVLHRARAHDPGGPSIHAANTPLLQKLGRMFPNSAWALSFDDAAHSVNDVLDIFTAHVRAHVGSEEIICAAVSHPKSMGEYERGLMRSFVNEARARFGDALEFTTYRDVYDGHTTHSSDPSRPFRSRPQVASVRGDGERSHSSA